MSSTTAAPLDAILRFTFDQPLGAAEPPCRTAHLSTERKVDAHPESATYRA